MMKWKFLIPWIVSLLELVMTSLVEMDAHSWVRAALTEGYFGSNNTCYRAKSSGLDVPISHSKIKQIRNVKTVSHRVYKGLWLTVFTFRICMTTECDIGTLRSNILCCCCWILPKRTSTVFIAPRALAMCDMSRGNVPLSSAPKLCALFEYDYLKELD